VCTGTTSGRSSEFSATFTINATPNHTRRRLRTLVGDVEEHLAENGPWKYRLSEIYYAPEVDLKVDVLRIRARFE